MGMTTRGWLFTDGTLDHGERPFYEPVDALEAATGVFAQHYEVQGDKLHLAWMRSAERILEAFTRERATQAGVMALGNMEAGEEARERGLVNLPLHKAALAASRMARLAAAYAEAYPGIVWIEELVWHPAWRDAPGEDRWHQQLVIAKLRINNDGKFNQFYTGWSAEESYQNSYLYDRLIEIPEIKR